MQELENITIEEAAANLRLRKATVWGWARNGKLPGAFKMPGSNRWLVDKQTLQSFEKKLRRIHEVQL